MLHRFAMRNRRNKEINRYLQISLENDKSKMMSSFNPESNFFSSKSLVPKVNWLLFWLFSLPVLAQNTIKVRILPTWDSKPITIPGRQKLVKGDSINLETFRIYLSKLCLLKNGKTVAKASKINWLADASNPLSLSLSIPVKKGRSFDTIEFFIGIDSSTQSGGAMAKDLDPIHGMYWTWQSGYIHVKLEGQYAKCQTRKQRFQWHIGGYSYPWSTIQKIRLPCNTQQELTIEISLDQFFKAAFELEQCEIMSPGPMAVKLSKMMSDSFHFRP